MRWTWLSLLCSGCALARLSSMGRSFPQLEGEIAEVGVQAPVRVIRDAHGVPHVRATSERDAWFGQGFVHGQDRLFQADLGRRVAYGQLSEWFGERAANYDAFAQALELRVHAAAIVERASPEAKAMLVAYTEGLNAGAASLEALPIEHRLLKSDFEPWTVEDCLGILFLQSWTLSENLSHEVAALRLRDLPPDVLDAVLRTDPESPPVDAYWDTLRQRDFGAETPEFLAFVGLLGGAPEASSASNNWVIGPERSADGAPIVANDPHLSQSVPSLWYAVDLQGGDLHLAGASLPGVPGVPIGHSERLAWGLTNVMADTVDLVVLEHAGGSYELDGVQKPLRQVPYEVWVRGEDEPRRGTIPVTELGPVITEVGDGPIVALRWATLEIEDHLPDVLWGLGHLASVQEALDAGSRYPLMVVQNLVVADVDGDWAWHTIGSMVARRAHTGRVPYPGSDPAQGWSDWHWMAGGVGERRPERGWVSTANSRPDDELADAISTAFVPSHRRDRIDARIAAIDAHTPADQSDIQLDWRELVADRHLDGLLAGVEPDTDAARRCFELLSTWDHDATPDAAGAAVFALFQREYLRHVLENDLGAAATAIVLDVASPGRSLLDAGSIDRFVDDRGASVSYALDRACVELEDRLGEEPAEWSWGALHPLALEHPFVSSAPRLLKRWNMVPVPWGGSGATVNAAGYGWGGPEQGVGGMASLRVVMPLSDLGSSTLVHPGGQSGAPGSSLYTSHYLHFVNGETLPLWFDDADVRQNVSWELVLHP